MNSTSLGKKRYWLIATLAGLYLYFLLPATAVVFYELYHLTGIDFVYSVYSLFKLGGYYFGSWQYQWVASMSVSLLIILILTAVSRLRSS